MNRFRTENRLLFDGIASADLNLLLEQLKKDYGIPALQICEAAAYSMSMVVRYALGLSADNGRVLMLPGDGLAGLVTLATARHLYNAGAEPVMVQLIEFSENNQDARQLLHPLTKQGIKLQNWQSSYTNGDFLELLGSCHNVICGLFSGNPALDKPFGPLVEILNEQSTPVHTVQAPLGVNVDTGERFYQPLFASSTLSLGLPLCGLAAGSQYAGRHYLCDISLPLDIYRARGITGSSLFSEQPVLRIFPDDGDKTLNEIKAQDMGI